MYVYRDFAFIMVVLYFYLFFTFRCIALPFSGRIVQKNISTEYLTRNTSQETPHKKHLTRNISEKHHPWNKTSNQSASKENHAPQLHRPGSTDVPLSHGARILVRAAAARVPTRRRRQHDEGGGEEGTVGWRPWGSIARDEVTVSFATNVRWRWMRWARRIGQRVSV